MDMGKVIIDYEGFKDVLGDYLTKNLIDEIISCMNDNLVFIEDIDEVKPKSDVKKVDTRLMTPKKAAECVRGYCRKHPYNVVIASEMKDARKALKEIKHYIDFESMYLEKENAAKKLGCKHYIHCEMNDLYLFYLSGQGFKPIIGNGGGEYVITSDNYLINVTGNSLLAIEQEVCLGTAAYGYMGIVEDVWHTNNFEKLLSEADMEPKRITVFDLLRNITSVKSFTSQIFSLTQRINSEEELFEKLTREFSKEEAAAIKATAKKGYPLSFDGLQK